MCTHTNIQIVRNTQEGDRKPLLTAELKLIKLVYSTAKYSFRYMEFTLSTTFLLR